MKIAKQLGIIILSMLLVYSLFSCRDDENGKIVDAGIQEEIFDNLENEENNENKEVVPEVVKSQFINKLTGLETTEFLSNQRPVAVMFNNLHAALPQVGISEMDIVYEITTEGAITRLMGLKSDWATLPTIGSIRSSRDYFIDVSDAHNAIYVHAGGSTYAYSEMWARNTEHIDGTNGNYASTSAFFRDAERLKTMSSEHTLMTSGEKLAAAIGKNEFSTTYKEDFECPVKFSDKKIDITGDTANYIYIPFSSYAQSYLDYDTETGLYNKGQYLNSRSSLDKHDSPHIDGATGKALSFTNVIILRASHSAIAGDTAGRIKVDFTGTGEGYYIYGGVCKEIKWEKETRTSGYTLFEQDGETELLLNPGKSYIAIVPTNAEIVYK